MASNRVAESLSMFGLLILCCGCNGSRELDRGSVNGKVTLNGAAVRDGTIVFRPIDATKGPIAGASIRDGHYAIDRVKGPAIGKNRVEISEFRKTGRSVTSRFGGFVEETAEAVPDRYNSKSMLVAVIKADKNTLDYELTSQK